MDTNDKTFPRWLDGHAQESGFGETAKPVYEWEHCVPRKVRDLDDVCVALGNGNGYLGLKIIQALVAHVEHADEAHPWCEDAPARSQFRIANDEWEEFREQYYLAREHGLGDRDAPLCDEAALDEHRAHMLYEAGDLIAVLVKILRAN